MEGYGSPIKAVDFHPGNEALPIDHEGVEQYCIIPSTSTSANNAAVVQVLIDNTPPTIRPHVNIIPHAEVKNLLIEPVFMVPEYADFYVAFGPRDTLDCSNAEYRPYRRFPFTTELAPTKVCVYGLDLADNKSGVFEYYYPQQ